MNIYAENAPMITTLELIEKIKKEIKNDTVYGVAKVMGTERTSVRNWLNGGVMTDSVALRAAEITDLDAGYVLYSMAAERAQKKGNIRLFEFWKKRADHVLRTGTYLSICFLLPLSSLPSPF